MERSNALRFFVSHCNSLLAHCLIDELRNDHVEESEECVHKFAGTLDPLERSDPPSIVAETADFSHLVHFSKALADSDVVIYHLPHSSPAEVRYVANCMIN